MISKESEKLEAIKKIQTKNIDLALAENKKLELLKDKAKELEERLRLFSENTHDLKTQVVQQNKRKWKFIAVSMVIFGIIGMLVRGNFISSMMIMIFSLLLGGIVGYGVYWGLQKTQKKKWSNESLKEQHKEAVLQAISKRAHARAIHPAFDYVKNLKNTPEPENKNMISLVFKK